jgi:hypothetical protein
MMTESTRVDGPNHQKMPERPVYSIFVQKRIAQAMSTNEPFSGSAASTTDGSVLLEPGKCAGLVAYLSFEEYVDAKRNGLAEN